MAIINTLFPKFEINLDCNLHEHIFQRPDQENWPDYTLYIDGATGKKRSFFQFKDRVFDAATALGTPQAQGGLGLSGDDGEIVGILSENCLDYPALVHSLFAITTPFALLSFYATKHELTHQMRLAKVTSLFVHPNVLANALPVAKELGIKNENIYILGGHVKGRKSFSDLVRLARVKKMKRLELKPAKKDALAYLVFSSGTSGPPKAVMISHGNVSYSLIQFIVAVQEALRVFTPLPVKTLEGIPTHLSFLPLYHTYGFHNLCIRAFMAPSTHVIMGKWHVESALKLISKYRISHFNLIPSVVHQIANLKDVKKYDLSSLTNVSSGAAYLPPDLSEKMAKLLEGNIGIAEGYGMSETTIAALSMPKPGMFDGRVNPARGATGILLPGLQARIVRDDGSDAPVGEAGELWLRGHNIALGYWNNEKATSETFSDGWLKTGDSFSVDRNYLFWFADRVKDTLKVSGMQVSPVEIEDVLLAQPDKLITDATVAGVQGFGRTSDERVPRAWVVLSSAGKKRPIKEVIQVLETYSQENLSKYKWLRGGIEIVREIPKLPTGKVLRRVLVDRYENKRQAKLKVKARL